MKDILNKLGGKSKKDFLKLLYTYQKVIDYNIICSITSVDGSIIYVNDKFCTVSKYSIEELIGKDHRIVNSGHHSKDFFSEMWTKIKAGKIWHGEMKSKAKDGSFFWLDTTILPVYDSYGKLDHFFSLRLLINDKKKLEEEKKEHARALQDMIFLTSHKVRLPISNILGIANQMEDCIDSKEELKEMIEYLKQSALTLDICTKEFSNFIYEMKKENSFFES